LKIEESLVCHECTVERIFSYLTQIADNHARNRMEIKTVIVLSTIMTEIRMGDSPSY
jgi:ribosomal protein L33